MTTPTTQRPELFGAKIRRLSDGTDGSRNGAGSAREMRVGPLPPWVETAAVLHRLPVD